jgi:hypothetical protein
MTPSSRRVKPCRHRPLVASGKLAKGQASIARPRKRPSNCCDLNHNFVVWQSYGLFLHSEVCMDLSAVVLVSNRDQMEYRLESDLCYQAPVSGPVQKQ